MYIKIGDRMPIRSRENLIGAWAFLIGVVLALVVGLFSVVAGETINQGVLGVLAILGLVVGYFVSDKDIHTFLIAAVSLVLVSFAGIQGLVLSAAILGVSINKLITNILGALMFLFIPSTIVVVLKSVFSIAQR